MSLSSLGLTSFVESATTQKPEFDDALSKRLIPFGVTYLDRMMLGVLPDDLVLIGAPSGVGKSELTTQIAINAAYNGKRVVMFALEYSPGEVELRTKYKLYANCVLKQHGPDALSKFTYLDYRIGKMKNLFKPYEAAVDEILSQMGDFQIFYRSRGFGLNDFKRIFNSVNDKADLVVVDHLHYFDLDDDNENRALTEIMKTTRDLNQLTEIPVIMVVHLRKSDKKERSLVSGLDDVHGSSNIVKIATKIITLAPGEALSDHQFKTYFRIAKCRIDGRVTKYVGVGTFNTLSNEYDPNFILGHLSQNEKEFIPISPDKIPKWYLSRANV